MDAVRVHRRIAALALAAAWLIPIFGALAHSEGHGHRYCEEHGAFEEGVARPASAIASPEASSAPASWSRAADADVVPLGHLQCPVAHPASRDAAVSEISSSAGALVRTVEPHATIDAELHAPLDVLSIAPKSSPPHA